MGFVNDAIIKYTLISQESVSSDFECEPFDISGADSGFSIQMALDNGSSPNITFSLHVSVNGQDYALLADSSQVFTDTDGSISWDVVNTQVCFVKVVASVTSGSIDITSALISAKRRH